MVKRTEGEISSVIVEPTEPPVPAPFPNRADFQRKLNRWICGATVRSVCIRVFLKSLADSGNRFLFVRVDTARVNMRVIRVYIRTQQQKFTNTNALPW